MKEKKPKTDYQRFTAAAKELGFEKLSRIGSMRDKGGEPNIIVEAWGLTNSQFQSRQYFMLVHDRNTGKIGVYTLVGASGAPVEADIDWLVKTYQGRAES